MEKSINILIRKILCYLLVISLISCVPTVSVSAAVTNDYTQWRQGDAAWNKSQAWPASQYPNAKYRLMSEAGCLVTSIAMLLRKYNVVTDTNVNNFNPWICNEKLKSVGAFDSAADLIWGYEKKAYPGFVYQGKKAYSASTLVSLYNQGYACIVSVNGNGHYVAVKSAKNTSEIVIMDPGGGFTSLSSFGSVNNIFYYKVTPSVTDKAPVGYLDAASGGINKIYVKGWAYDPDSTDKAVFIHIYVDGKCVATTTANKERVDVHNVNGCGKYHGYEVTFDYKVNSTDTHKVETYALNTNTSGINTRLQNSPKIVTVTADTTKPKISNISVVTDSKGYTITCDVSDNVAIDRVQCPTWTVANGQDDLDKSWQTSAFSKATIENGKAIYRVNISDHNNEYGQYITDIYVYDKAGNVGDARKGVTLTKLCEHSYKRIDTEKATLSKDGKRNYECTLCGKKKSDTIYRASAVKLSTASYTYNGKIKSPTVVVKDSKGNTISPSNYSVKKPSGRKNVGKYTYKITFKNEYTGTKSLTLTINPKGTSISKLSKAKKAFTVKWKKQSGKMGTSRISGYQIQYSTSKKFADAKNKSVSGYSKTSKKITGLKAKKTYYVRIRTYKTVKVNGKSTKLYSGWSSAKSVKTK